MNDICTNPSVNILRIWIGIKLKSLVHVCYSAVDIYVPEYEKKLILRKQPVKRNSIYFYLKPQFINTISDQIIINNTMEHLKHIKNK